MITYDIEVVTGDEDDAGTQSNVYMTLRGKHSDTGRRNIVRHPGDTTLFGKGQTDKLKIEAVSLGQLEKCIVGHDGSEPGKLIIMIKTCNAQLLCIQSRI